MNGPAPAAPDGDDRELEIVEGVELAPRTTLGLGGACRWWTTVTSSAELRWAGSWARERGAPLLVLGGGSNLVVADEGFDGLVVEIGHRGFRLENEGEQVRVRLGAGLEWEAVVARLVEEEGLAGVECLSGIPGRCGAAPIQNIGAYGQEIAEVVETVWAWDFAADELRAIDRPACRFGYRASRFKAAPPGRWAVLEVELKLERKASPVVRYAELRRRLGMSENGPAPKPVEVRQAVLELRRGKSMILDDADPESRSAGSFFVNPVIGEDLAVALRAANPELPSWPAARGQVKLSAGWLIEAAGFRKGEERAGIGISKRHALALVHRGEGTTTELVRRAAEVRSRVRERFGVVLEPEPVFVGFREVGTGRALRGAEVLDLEASR